ncbi:MAG TPA: bifunctional diaminohydroxyphosphoribosylaminopyrimidine deaminase/5-amino-6-(5-phosphoribosylamino)uracil reductase RibD [Polyangia bacterium]|jgi:diaminohydroxyphosphoribosylaminopyrimidine deaminase/5-amino-6-(5-phosphoribosylamino)uracil reductase|nr:bifunctional diaminohydroxyphosphoribosylaminopyrimidine deaminase/5-amino-6-(5-phosphoribosylamino)uracil reductase RibD [Polyangia bacterium]
MRRALALAARGRGSTRPNPLVGAVIARGGRVVAEGFHRRAGAPHAEVNALVRLRPGAARGATLYVNLEPCCHTGRTGPCTEAILAAGIGRVVVGMRDPNPLVDGRGVARLRRAGVRVDVGCLEAESLALNRAFAIWVRERRPLVTLKAAASLDGFIAPAKIARPRKRRAPVWITGPEARRVAHELRAAHDAVLVGSGTVLVDDPHLTVRLPDATCAPTRVVLDGRLRTPTKAHVLAGGAPTLIFTRRGASPARVRALRAAGAEVVELAAARGHLPIAAVLRALAARDIQSVLVEGGAAVHGAFIAAGLVDDVALFIAPRLLGGGVPLAAGLGRALAEGLALGPISARAVGGDLLLTGQATPEP